MQIIRLKNTKPKVVNNKADGQDNRRVRRAMERASKIKNTKLS
jgi:hypothetical protein